MLRAILNKSWRKHPTRHQLYGHLPPITKTIQVRRARHAGHCWRSRDELISDVLLWTPTYGRAEAGPPARIYIQQLCEDTGCGPEDLPEAMNEKWRERVRDIRACGTHDMMMMDYLMVLFISPSLIISRSCSPLTNPLRIISSAPITIGIKVILMFQICSFPNKIYASISILTFFYFLLYLTLFLEILVHLNFQDGFCAVYLLLYSSRGISVYAFEFS